MTIDVAWLETEILGRKLSEAESKLVASIVSETSYAAGETIIETGKPGGQLHMMRSGSASVVVRKEGEEPLTVAQVDAGKLFGELTFLNNKPATADVIANEDCVVYKLKREDLANATHEQPQLAYLFFSAIMERQSGVIMEQHVALASELRDQKKRGTSTTTKVVIAAIAALLIAYILSTS